LDQEDGAEDFIHNYEIMTKYVGYERAVVVTYFAFTSLSTVGFGDYVPKNSQERIFCVLILLFGNMIFGYIIGNFNEMIDELKNFNQDTDDEENLNRFFNLLSRFNKNRQIPEEIKFKIEKYFEYKWNNDRNVAVSD
jgi:hypothetical protein